MVLDIVIHVIVMVLDIVVHTIILATNLLELDGRYARFTPSNSD